MRTEAQFYNDHLGFLIGQVETKISVLEGKSTMDDQDEMELEALDTLLQDLERLNIW